MIRSPLQYPGSKRNAISKLLPLIQENVGITETLLSPFIGGGSLELAMAETGIHVIGCDFDVNLVNLWQQLHQNYGLLLAEVLDHRMYIANHTRETSIQFLEVIKNRVKENRLRQDGDRILSAGEYYAAARCSFYGSVVKSGWRLQLLCRYPMTLPQISHLSMSFEALSYEQSLSKYPTLPCYADPPYYGIGEKPYLIDGQSFDHVSLRNHLASRAAFWIASYNDCPEIRDLYAEFNIYGIEWNYQMGKKRGGSLSNEILISNTDLKHHKQLSLFRK